MTQPSRKNPSKPRAGDVLFVENAETTKGRMSIDDEQARLLMVFLGTAIRGDDPDVPGRLSKLGWTRSIVYEVTAQLGDGEQRWAHRLNYLAQSPRDAAFAGIRFARVLLEEERKSVKDNATDITLLSLIVRTMKLGTIDDEGKPHNGRGPAFVTWGAESGQSLDDLAKQIEETK